MTALSGLVTQSKADLLRLNNDNAGTGITGTLSTVYDGSGNITGFKLSSTGGQIGNIQLSGNTLTTSTGAITINSASTVCNFGTATGSTVTIGNSTGTTTINGTVTFGGGLSFTNLTISNTLTLGTLAATHLGTPGDGTLTNCTGLPIATGVSGLASGAATFLTTPSSANLLALITDETGTGKAVFATSPALTTPLLGTPTSGTLTNCTGYPTANLSGLVALTQGGSGYSNSQALVQRVSTTVTPTSGSATIPNDSTFPQSSEGAQIVTLTITPKNASNKLVIRAVTNITTNTAGVLILALFQDSTANALAAACDYIGTANASDTMAFAYEMVAGTTSATTFKLRFGESTAASWKIGEAQNTLGGASDAMSIFEILEYTP